MTMIPNNKIILVNSSFKIIELKHFVMVIKEMLLLDDLGSYLYLAILT